MKIEFAKFNRSKKKQFSSKACVFSINFAGGFRRDKDHPGQIRKWCQVVFFCSFIDFLVNLQVVFFFEIS